MGETVAIGTGDRARGAFQSVSPLFVAVLAVLGLFAMRLALHGQSLATSLGDTDDATRLVQLRLLIEHGRWFDLSLPTIGALEPLVSHWSRLIDAGLASIYLVLRPLVGGSAAEIGMRVLWPAMLLLGLALLVVREAVRDAGDSAG